MSRLRTPAWAILLVLSACATTDGRHRDPVREQEVAGAVIGGILGGVIGHQFGDGRGQTAMTIAGAAAGALIGGSIARDRAVSMYERDAAYTALERTPSGRPVPWRDDDLHLHGSYTPLRTYRDRDHRYCREYQQIIFIDGREERAYGIACRQPDGSWQIQD